MSDSTVEYEKILSENEAKGFQIRLVVNTFRDVEYLHLRKYFLSFDDGFVPSKEGVSMPYSIQSTWALLDGVLDIVSKTEGLDAITEHLTKKISDLQGEAN